MTLPDSELVARAVSHGDPAAFGELVRRHQSPVRRFLRHLAHGDEAWADDLAQETFVQAYRGLARYRGEGRFLTWLLGIAHNRFRNARRNRSGEARFLADGPLDGAIPSFERLADLQQDLSAALDRLSADEQTAIRLAYGQGLSHEEIAAALGWPLGTVKTHLARSKDKLRELLSAWNPRT